MFDEDGNMVHDDLMYVRRENPWADYESDDDDDQNVLYLPGNITAINNDNLDITMENDGRVIKDGTPKEVINQI